MQGWGLIVMYRLYKSRYLDRNARRILMKCTDNYIGSKMLIKFAVRFMGVLLSVLALVAMVIHFFFSSHITTDLWIIMVPVILGIPMLTSVVIAKDEELSLH